MPFVWVPQAGRGEEATAMACVTGLGLWVWMASGLDISPCLCPRKIVGQHGAGSACFLTQEVDLGNKNDSLYMILRD